MEKKFIIKLIKCFIQNTEPVGSKAPTFSTASKISMFVQKSGDDLALLCQAQAFPVPLIRYVISKA